MKRWPSVPNKLIPVLLPAPERGIAPLPSTRRPSARCVIACSGEPQPNYTTILSVIQKLEDVYHKSRPTLRVEPGKVLELDDHVGLHPSLKDLYRLGDR